MRSVGTSSPLSWQRYEIFIQEQSKEKVMNIIEGLRSSEIEHQDPRLWIPGQVNSTTLFPTPQESMRHLGWHQTGLLPSCTVSVPLFPTPQENMRHLGWHQTGLLPSCTVSVPLFPTPQESMRHLGWHQTGLLPACTVRDSCLYHCSLPHKRA